MNNNLKFRAYDKFNDCFFYSEKMGVSRFFWQVEELKENGIIVDIQSDKSDVNNETLYENDIIEHEGVVALLYWSHEFNYMSWKIIKSPSYYDAAYGDSFGRSFQLVGNAHEHSDEWLS
jgi:hypothetical protein